MNPKEETIQMLEQTLQEELKKIDNLKSKEEQIQKFNVIYNMHKIFSNYDELEPVLTDFFDKKRRENFER